MHPQIYKQMRNIKFIMSYRGTNYHGFQKQDNAVTIQGVLEEVASKLFNEKTSVVGCSRTDTGVHANEFCFSLKTKKTIPCENIILAMNTFLPEDISILSAEDVPYDFHPRYSSVAKEYVYLIHTGKVRNPFAADLMYHYKRPLDFSLFAQVAAFFEGTHDFSAFCSAGSEVKNTVRTIYYSTAIKNETTVSLKIKGNGFLYNMIRIIVGTILEVNEGIIPINEIPEIISSRNRTRAGRTEKPHGLYLNKVFY